MGWVSEFGELAKKLKFFGIVYEWQRGMYFLNGTKRERRVRPSLEQRLTLQEAERQVRHDLGWYAFLPFRRPKMPDGYRQGRVLGLPRCTLRDTTDTVLRPGAYFFPPFVGLITVESIQEDTVDLKNISVITSTDEDGKRAVMMSAVMVARVIDPVRAFVRSKEYLRNIGTYAIAEIGNEAHGRPYRYWTKKRNIRALEREVLLPIREKAEEWGVEISRLMINDVVPHDVKRYSHEGIPPPPLRSE